MPVPTSLCAPALLRLKLLEQWKNVIIISIDVVENNQGIPRHSAILLERCHAVRDREIDECRRSLP